MMSGGSRKYASSLGSAATGRHPRNLGISGGCDDSGDTINVTAARIVQGVSTSCTATLPAAEKI